MSKNTQQQRAKTSAASTTSSPHLHAHSSQLIYVCLFSLISSLRWWFISWRAQVPLLLHSWIFYIWKAGFPIASPVNQPSCSLFICVKQLPMYLTPTWTSTQGLGWMNWKGRLEAGGDFVLRSLASFPPANWTSKTTFEKTEFLHRVLDYIIVPLLHSPGHATKIAFIHWMLATSALHTSSHNNLAR